MLGFGVRAFFVLAVLAGFGPVAGAEARPRYSDAQLIDGFLKTVFGSEFGRMGGQTYLVKKFNRPVRVFVDQRARRDRRAAVQQFVGGLGGQIRGIDIRLVGRKQDANLVVHVVDRAQYRDLVRSEILRNDGAHAPGRCLFRVMSGAKGISRSDAVIVSDEGEFLFRRCLVEEVLQSLGPVNDNASLADSVFNDASKQQRFTTFDRYILNMLYDRRVKAGMSAEEVRRVLPAVLTDVRKRIR